MNNCINTVPEVGQAISYNGKDYTLVTYETKSDSTIKEETGKDIR